MHNDPGLQIVLRLIHNKWDESNLSCTLNCFAHHALMSCTCSCGSTRNDFASLGSEPTKILGLHHLLVIHVGCFFHAKHTNLTSWSSEFVRPSTWSCWTWPTGSCGHELCPLNSMNMLELSYSSAKGSLSSSSGIDALEDGAAEAIGREGGAEVDPDSESPLLSNPSIASATISYLIRF